MRRRASPAAQPWRELPRHSPSERCNRTGSVTSAWDCRGGNARRNAFGGQRCATRGHNILDAARQSRARQSAAMQPAECRLAHGRSRHCPSGRPAACSGDDRSTNCIPGRIRLKRLSIAIGIIVALIAAVIIVGYSLPIEHTAQRSVELRAAPGDVWLTITDVAAYPAWREDIDEVEVLAPVDGRQAWRESGDNGGVEYVARVVEPPARMVSRITSDDLPFGGEWEYLVEPAETGSRITISERGEVYNPIFRFVSRFILGHTTTMDEYIRALGRKFGATVVTASP